MKVKLIANGVEIEVEISQEQLDKLCSKKKTGYERVNSGEKFYLPANNSEIITYHDDYNCADDILYNVANYYSDKTVAENNARADRLMRQLRRFAVEHREKEFDWESDKQAKYYICYFHYSGLTILNSTTAHSFGSIYFNKCKTAQLAIDTFKDELLWYFTKYKDSL